MKGQNDETDEYMGIRAINEVEEDQEYSLDIIKINNSFEQEQKKENFLILNDNNNQNNKKDSIKKDLLIKNNEFDEREHLIEVLDGLSYELKNSKKDATNIDIIYENYLDNQFISRSHIKDNINGCIKFIFFVIGPLYGIIFLMGIFQMKSIMGALSNLVEDSTVMFFKCNVNSNCNVTISKDEINVYDFYNYYYDYTMNETINFNLMMITAFIGGLLLRWKGFKITTGLLCIPSFGATVWLWNFNYNFKVDGVFDYDILKIINLTLIYILYLCGIGGSALLSQQILIEGHLKYKFQNTTIYIIFYMTFSYKLVI